MPVQKPTKKDLTVGSVLGLLFGIPLVIWAMPSKEPVEVTALPSNTEPESDRQEPSIAAAKTEVDAIRELLQGEEGVDAVGGVEASYIQDALTNPFNDIEGVGIVTCAALFEYGEPYPVACFGDSLDDIKASSTRPLKTPLGVWVYAGKIAGDFRYHPVDTEADLWGSEIKESEYYGSWILETYPDSDRLDIEAIREKGRELILSGY